MHGRVDLKNFFFHSYPIGLTFFCIFRVTKEHREGLAKNAKALFSKNKESLQSIEKKYTKQLKTKAGISKDEIRNVTDVVSMLHFDIRHEGFWTDLEK